MRLGLRNSLRLPRFLVGWVACLSSLFTGCLILIMPTIFAQANPVMGEGGLPASSSSSGVTLSLIDAVSSAILQDSSVKLAGFDVAASRDRVTRAEGAFDLRISTQVQQAHTYYPLTNYQHDLALTAGINTFSETLNFTQVQVTGQKLSQSGIEFLPQFSMSRAADNLENLGGVNRTNLNLQVRFPLLRDRGRQITTAPLRAAKLDLQSKLSQQKETAARTVYAAVTAYWRYVAAEEHLQQRQAQLKRSSQLNDIVATLIQSDHLPASGSHEAKAAMENDETDVLLARQTVLEARQALGDAMAFAPMDSLLLGAPTDALPTPPAIVVDLDPARLIAFALQHRPDVTASRTVIDSAELERKTAVNGLRSRLDLTVRSGYTGLALGTNGYDYFDSTATRVQGADIQGSLNYTWDPSNREAKGRFAEAQTGVDRAREAAAATARAIGSEVITALGELEASRGALTQSLLVEQELRRVRSDTQDRLSAAVGVLNDVLSAENTLSAAEVATVDARTRYALAVARLRYATGTLLGPDPEHPTLERSNLITEPRP